MNTTTATATTAQADRYRAIFANQEDAEVMPNEVAGRLADLIGAPHLEVHGLLLELNPALRVCGESLTLSVADLTAICTHLVAPGLLSARPLAVSIG